MGWEILDTLDRTTRYQNPVHHNNFNNRSLSEWRNPAALASRSIRVLFAIGSIATVYRIHRDRGTGTVELRLAIPCRLLEYRRNFAQRHGAIIGDCQSNLQHLRENSNAWIHGSDGHVHHDSAGHTFCHQSLKRIPANEPPHPRAHQEPGWLHGLHYPHGHRDIRLRTHFRSHAERRARGCRKLGELPAYVHCFHFNVQHACHGRSQHCGPEQHQNPHLVICILLVLSRHLQHCDA